MEVCEGALRLFGSYCRGGPGLFEVVSAFRHWFDGYAMLLRIALAQASLLFSARATSSRRAHAGTRGSKDLLSL